MKKNTYTFSIILLCMGFLLSLAVLSPIKAQPPLPSFQNDDKGDDEPEPGDKPKKKKKKTTDKPAKRAAKGTKKPKDDDADADTEADAGQGESNAIEKPSKEPTPGEAVTGEQGVEKVADAGSAGGPDASGADDASDAGETPEASEKPEADAQGKTASADSNSPDARNSNAAQTDSPPSRRAMLQPDSAPTMLRKTAKTTPPTPAVPPLVIAKDTPGVTIVSFQKDTAYNLQKLIWELRAVWVIIALLLLSFSMLFFHALLPFGGLSFLSKGSYGLLRLSAGLLLVLLGYRTIMSGEWPGATVYSGILLFAFVALESYNFRKKQFTDVYLPGLPLLLIVAGALLWSLLKPIGPVEQFSVSHAQHWLFGAGQTLKFAAFGILAAAGSWLLASGYLGVLAKRDKGIGYGLAPQSWNQLQLQPGVLVLLAYPLLTITWLFQVAWSLQYFGSPWQAWWQQPQDWAVIFSWIVLSAYLFALRAPRRASAFESVDDHVIKTNKLPSFLLLIATLGSAIIYVGANHILKLLQG